MNMSSLDWPNMNSLLLKMREQWIFSRTSLRGPVAAIQSERVWICGTRQRIFSDKNHKTCSVWSSWRPHPPNGSSTSLAGSAVAAVIFHRNEWKIDENANRLVFTRPNHDSANNSSQVELRHAQRPVCRWNFQWKDRQVRAKWRLASPKRRQRFPRQRRQQLAFHFPIPPGLYPPFHLF